MLKIFFAILLLRFCNGEIEENTTDVYRLSDKVIPIHYDLHIIIKPDFEMTKSYDGEVRIELKFSHSTSSFKFHSSDVIFSLISFKSCTSHLDVDCESIPISTTTYLSRITKFKIQLNSKIENFSNNTFYLICNYQGKLFNNPEGIYLLNYEDIKTDKWMISTQFLPVYARRAIPCFDEPNKKATFLVSVTRPSHMYSKSNGKLIETISINDTLKTDKFSITPRMSIHNLELMVSDFEMRNINNVSQRVICGKNVSINESDFLFEIVPKLIKYYEDLTQIRYFGTEVADGKGHISKTLIDHLSSPVEENWLLKTYTSACMYGDKIEATRAIASELAHIWFGNVVTYDWWDYTWLTNGFVRLYEYLAVSEVTEWNLMPSFHNITMKWSLENDMDDEQEPLNFHISGYPKSIRSKFSELSYEKGAVLIFMMKNFLGNSNYIKGIREYFRKNAYNNTIDDDLWSAFDFANNTGNLPASVQDIMKTWTNQSGYPVITVVRNYKKPSSVIITQRESKYKYYVPVWFTTSERLQVTNETTLVWLTPESQTATIDNVLNNESDWILISGTQGYYQVKYEEILWKNMASALNYSDYGNISVIERARINGEVFSFYKEHTNVNCDTAVTLNSYILKEKDFFPIISALEPLVKLRYKYYDNEVVKKVVELYFQQLLKKLNGLHGYEIWKNNFPLMKIACEMGDRNCINYVTNTLYSKLMFGNSEAIDKRGGKLQTSFFTPELMSIILCNAIRYNVNSDNWYYLLDHFFHSKRTEEKKIILNSFGCTQNTELRFELFNYLFNDSIVPRYFINENAVFKIISNSPSGANDFVKFTQIRYGKIIRYYKNVIPLFDILRRLSVLTNSNRDLSDLKELLTDYSYSSMSDRAEVMEIAERKVEQLNTKSDSITNCFKILLKEYNVSEISSRSEGPLMKDVSQLNFVLVIVFLIRSFQFLFLN